ncbi:MAG: hemerythrin domain-containing protein [Nitrososphaerales archaeon]
MAIASNLVKDHEVILKVLDSLELKLSELRRTGSISLIDYLDEMLDFSRVFIDRCHHGKEEKCLFPCIEKRGIPKEGGPIGVMLMEHEMGRNLVKKIREKLDLYKKREVKLDEVIEPCYEYLGLLRQHIYKENNILFPMADEVVTKEDIDDTSKCYEKREEEVGEHERLEKLAHKLLRS